MNPNVTFSCSIAVGGGHGPTLERAKGDPYLGLLATADGTRVYGRAGSTRTVLVAAKDANIDAKLMRDVR